MTAITVLAHLLREAAARTQVIVATHSDTLVRFLEPKEVIVMETGDDGCTTARWADSLDVEAWLGEYGLDELWRMGRIGGRP